MLLILILIILSLMPPINFFFRSQKFRVAHPRYRASFDEGFCIICFGHIFIWSGSSNYLLVIFAFLNGRPSRKTMETRNSGGSMESHCVPRCSLLYSDNRIPRIDKFHHTRGAPQTSLFFNVSGFVGF